MSLLHRYASIALVATALVGCSGEADVDVDADTATLPAATAPVDTGAPSTTASSTGDTLGSATPQGAINRPVLTTDEQERIDDWLTAYADSLNDYGDPKGTMYAGGTPLFNESQGKPITKYEYIAAKHPEKPWNQPLPEGEPVKREGEEKASGKKSGTKTDEKAGRKVDAKAGSKPN